jgi:predicted O-methyltransferase YrrM
MARALPEGGSLTSLEIDPKHAEVARQNIERARLSRMVKVETGDARDVLPKIAGTGRTFDLIFIDADKANIPVYFEWALKLSHRGSMILVDNVVREGAVIEENSRDPSVLGVRKLNEMLASEPRVSSTVIQTVGVKGYDGLTVALVISD